MYSSYTSSLALISFSCLIASGAVSAWIVGNPGTIGSRGRYGAGESKLYEANPKHDVAPKHDVGGGGNPMDQFTPEQLERAQAYMEHQQGVEKLGYPVDVRSLIQYNHGFAVMSTNSKS